MNTNVNGFLQVLIAINGTTLLTVMITGFRIARHLGKVEAYFDLLWADYKARKEMS